MPNYEHEFIGHNIVV